MVVNVKRKHMFKNFHWWNIFVVEQVQKYVGEGARMVRELFEMARTKKACLIFFDEIDAVGGARFDDGAGGDNEVQRTMLELINQVILLHTRLIGIWMYQIMQWFSTGVLVHTSRGPRWAAKHRIFCYLLVFLMKIIIN